MFKKLVLILLFFIITNSIKAQIHAGEITFAHIAGSTYEITATLYCSAFGAPVDSICIGDSSSAAYIPLSNSSYIGNGIGKNTYTYQHIFPGGAPSSYIIYTECLNRYVNIKNIPTPATIFYIESELYINPFLGINNSPTFLNDGVDTACINNLSVYNSSAVDSDGDSLYYTLQQSLKEGGQLIPSYQYPNASNSFTINNNNGDVSWDTPTNPTGYYNFDILIEEYRDGSKIGSVLREVQVDVNTCNVGIKENSNSSALVTYPNPFNKQLTIEYKLENNSAKLTVYNLVLEQVKTQFITENITQINLSNLVNGIYFLRITDGTTLVTQKIIKQ